MGVSFGSMAIVAAVALAGRQLLAAALLQATSLSLLVVAGRIGVDLGLLRPTTYVALVAAGLLSVVAFPLVALTLLRGRAEPVSRPEAAVLPAGPTPV